MYKPANEGDTAEELVHVRSQTFFQSCHRMETNLFSLGSVAILVIISTMPSIHMCTTE